MLHDNGFVLFRINETGKLKNEKEGDFVTVPSISAYRKTSIKRKKSYRHSFILNGLGQRLETKTQTIETNDAFHL